MAGISKEERERRAAERDAAERQSQEGGAFENDGHTIDNPREPVHPVAEGAEPKTFAAGAVGGPGTPGYVEPGPAEAVTDTRVVEAPRVQMVDVVIKRGYFPADGSGKLAEGTETSLPIEEARSLIENGIAEYVAHVPNTDRDL